MDVSLDSFCFVVDCVVGDDWLDGVQFNANANYCSADNHCSSSATHCHIDDGANADINTDGDGNSHTHVDTHHCYNADANTDDYTWDDEDQIVLRRAQR